MDKLEQEYINKINNTISNQSYIDNEEIHCNCDDLLLEYLEKLGHTEIVKSYEDVKNKIGFWYA